MLRVAARLTTVAGLLAASAVSGCGSDSEGSSGANSGVDSSKPVNMLTTDEAQRVCTAVASYGVARIPADVVRRSVCVRLTVVQIANPPTVAECNETVNRCTMTAQNMGQTTAPPTPACMGG